MPWQWCAHGMKKIEDEIIGSFLVLWSNKNQNGRAREEEESHLQLSSTIIIKLLFVD
jgi:hypothetical protein